MEDGHTLLPHEDYAEVSGWIASASRKAYRSILGRGSHYHSLYTIPGPFIVCLQFGKTGRDGM